MKLFNILTIFILYTLIVISFGRSGYTPDCEKALESNPYRSGFPGCWDDYNKANGRCVTNVMDYFQPGMCESGYDEFYECSKDKADAGVCELRGIITTPSSRYDTLIYIAVPNECMNTFDQMEIARSPQIECSRLNSTTNCFYMATNCVYSHPLGTTAVVFITIACCIIVFAILFFIYSYYRKKNEAKKDYSLLDNNRSSYVPPVSS